MDRICRVSGKLSKAMQRVEVVLGSMCLVAMLTLMLVNAVARYLFDFPIIWSDEMNNFFFIWIGFLSCAYVMGNDGHMRVTAVLGALPGAARYAVGLFTNAVMLCAFILFIPPLVRLMEKVTFSGLLRIPLAYIYCILPVSFTLMAIHILNNMIQSTGDFLRERRVAQDAQ